MITPTAEIIGFIGFGLSLTAAWLQWNLPYTISRLEDKLKDGRINSGSMKRRIWWAQLMPVVCTLIGASLLVGAVIKLLN